MIQEFASPVIQQPKKLKKHFCFATIPLIIIALSSLFISIEVLKSIPSNWYELLGNEDYLCEIISDFMCLFHFAFFFIGAVMLAILLFAKKNNFLLGLPLLMFSAGYLFMCGATVVNAYGLTCGEEIIFDTFAAALWDNLPFILIYFSSSVAFFVVAVYTFIVTLRKKPAPKVLWIIPAILFCILYAPFPVCLSISFIEMAFIDILWALEMVLHNTPYYLMYGLLPIAVILFLIWLSFPYKKDKSKKPAEVQPVPAETVMPDPVISAPVVPEIQPEPEVQPVAEAKTEEVDPERTVDYSYAEVFYPPVKAPEVKPEPEPQPEPEPVVETKPEPEPQPEPEPAVSNDIEKLKNSKNLLREYKELLDDGLITQEDYDKKKNELLGL